MRKPQTKTEETVTIKIEQYRRIEHAWMALSALRELLYSNEKYGDMSELVGMIELVMREALEEIDAGREASLVMSLFSRRPELRPS